MSIADDLPMSRARLFVLFDSFERDIRSALSRHLLDYISDEEALGVYFQSASQKREKDGDRNASLVDFLNLREGYDILNSHRNLLPVELAREAKDLTNNLDRLVVIRNRVMHARPLSPGDSHTAVSLLAQYQSRFWSELKKTLAELAADPTWEPIVEIANTGGLALHNLPLSDYDETGLVGRSDEVKDLLERLKNPREAVLTIVGEGGIGKTALALEVAYRIVDDPDRPYDAVLWTSLKFEKLTADGVRTIAGALHDLASVAEPLGQALDLNFEGGLRELASALEGLRVLIVIDNLETVGGNEFSLMYDALPNTVKYLITSRVGVGEYERRYPLGPLSKRDSLHLFNDFVKLRRVSTLVRLSSDQRADVVAKLRNSPIGIKWFVLAVGKGSDPAHLLRNQDELLEFCVRSVYDSLGFEAQQIISALSLLDRPVTIDELVLLLEKSSDEVNSGLQELWRGSMVSRDSFGEGSDLLMRISLTDTAQNFLSRRIEFDAEFEREILRRDSEFRLEESRHETEMARRSLQPSLVRTRSVSDNATAQMLRNAMLNAKTDNSEQALSMVQTARQLNPEYWEVDRVEGFIRGYLGQVGQATKCYERAYQLSTGDDRGMVAHFFAGHLARNVKDVGRAISLEEEANDELCLAETAVALGTYLSWAGRYKEAVDHIEPAIPKLAGKAWIIAIMVAAETYQQWASYSRLKERNPRSAFAHAQRGGVLVLGALESGISDDKLRDRGQDCVTEALNAAIDCLLAGIVIDDLDRWLEGAAQSIKWFIRCRYWRALVVASERIASIPGCPTGGQLLLNAVRSIDHEFLGEERESGGRSIDVLKGQVVSLKATFGFISHPDHPGNLFFHAGSVLGKGILGLSMGCLVTFALSDTDRGTVAIDVIRID